MAFGVHQVVPSGAEVEEAVIFASLTTLEKEMGYCVIMQYRPWSPRPG